VPASAVSGPLPVGPFAVDRPTSQPPTDGLNPLERVVGAAVAARWRRPLLTLLVAVTGILVPWTVLLAFTLPSHYVVVHWAVVWIGLDVAEFALLAGTAYLAFRCRPQAALLAWVAATVLCCDAFFDVATASTRVDVTASIVSALIIELPLAGLLFALGWRFFRRVLGRFAEAPRPPAAPVAPAATAPAPAAGDDGTVRDNAAMWITTVVPARAHNRDGTLRPR